MQAKLEEKKRALKEKRAANKALKAGANAPTSNVMAETDPAPISFAEQHIQITQVIQQTLTNLQRQHEAINITIDVLSK